MTVMFLPTADTGTVSTVDTSTGDHDKFTHLVVEGFWPLDGDGERTGEFVPVGGNSTVEGVVMGSAVKALCGKVWVPTELDGTRYPLCLMCKDIAVSRGWKVPS